MGKLQDIIHYEVNKYLLEMDGWKEFKEEWQKTFTFDKKEVSEIGEMAETISKMCKRKLQHTAPTIPFSNLTEKERAFMDSTEHPKNYYHFQAFGVKICIHYMKGFSTQKMGLKKGDWYLIACFGWFPRGKDFQNENWKCYSPRLAEHAISYWQATQDLETAVVNFYWAIHLFLEDIGIRTAKSMEFVFDETKLEQKI